VKRLTKVTAGFRAKERLGFIVCKHDLPHGPSNAGVSIESPDMLPFCRWLEQTSVGAVVRDSSVAVFAIDTLLWLGIAALGVNYRSF